MKWYKADIREISEAEYEKWLSVMSEENKTRTEKFKISDDKKGNRRNEKMDDSRIDPLPAAEHVRHGHGRRRCVDPPGKSGIHSPGYGI